MIYGIGTDIVSIERMARNLEKYDRKFAERILTDNELGDYDRLVNNRADFLAKRYAAKEAVAKAMGLGFRDGLQLRQIGVGHDEYGKPVLETYGFAEKFFSKHNISDSHLSLSDEKAYAVAFVTLECNKGL
ncbi:MAG: holo-ACP synthase [Gammaproteobacteria bacterium]|nr:MAG: holo-ACP synthase [Gammaproteobacteria bacterium]